jgi:hypothetical protein
VSPASPRIFANPACHKKWIIKIFNQWYKNIEFSLFFRVTISIQGSAKSKIELWSPCLSGLGRLPLENSSLVNYKFCLIKMNERITHTWDKSTYLVNGRANKFAAENNVTDEDGEITTWLSILWLLIQNKPCYCHQISSVCIPFMIHYEWMKEFTISSSSSSWIYNQQSVQINSRKCIS